MRSDDELLDLVHDKAIRLVARRRARMRQLSVVASALVIAAAALVWTRDKPDQRVVADEARDSSQPGLTLEISDTNPKTGALVVVHAAEEGGDVLEGIVVDWGDESLVPTVIGDGHQCGSTNVTSRRQKFTHSYRSPGSYTITATAHVVWPCRAVDEQYVSFETTQAISVTGARTTKSNGAVVPNVSMNAGLGDEPGRDALRVVSAVDRDGYIQSLSVDWGDGSSPSVATQNMAPCREDKNGWPALNGENANMHHHYDMAGDFTVTLTAVSVGCDGKSPQEETLSDTFHAT